MGLGSGGGKENSLDVLRRLAVGDSLLIDMLRYLNDCYEGIDRKRLKFFPEMCLVLTENRCPVDRLIYGRIPIEVSGCS